MKLAKKYNLKIITKYGFYKEPYIHKNSFFIDKLPSTNNSIIYLIDGLDMQTVNKLENLGYIIIGYIN